MTNQQHGVEWTGRGMDRSTKMKQCQVARQGALGALPAMARTLEFE